ncbi:uncharacterized protein LOC127837052 isoform X2 [Dreissena polymorpha]|uniref:uncharacterized protein LOC127837052 isoform X2 n=1 Tax=Dreissena polymorpha TaxID=45954 RepID=UPI002264B59F|nr:uncharacterized protein LOC127837052 isoform X2 [Dreissena polymorpha]
MDKQKPTTKITRKMASMSQDHNNLMMYYTKISTDESGAPMRWKMTSLLRVDDEKITSSKSNQGSNKSSPSSSREPSGERRGRPSLSELVQSQRVKRTPSRDSSESSYSRDSSTESRGREKPLKSDKQNQDGDIMNSANVDKKLKGKRGRPRSLDLSTKTMTNGDDEKFKSPHPLTPCNIVVKRRKGRPKETPPTLTAEPPVASLNIPGQDTVGYGDEMNMVDQRKPVLKKRILQNAQLLKSVRNKTSISNTFLKRRKLGALNRKSGVNFETKSSILTDSTQSGYSSENMSANCSSESLGESFPMKRKAGRPPGAKNKPKVVFNPLAGFVPKRKVGGRPLGSKNKVILGLKKPNRSANRLRLKEKPAKTVTSSNDSSSALSKDFNNVESVSKACENFEEMKSSPDLFDSPEQNTSSVIKTEESAQEEQKMDGSGTASNSCFETMVTEDINENIVETISPELDLSINEAIETVLHKVKNDLPIDKPSSFTCSSGPKFGGIRRMSKIKKNNKHQMQKHKQVLESGVLDTENKTFALLPWNDLRRKLHSKQLNKKIEQMHNSVVGGKEISTVVDLVNLGGDLSVKTENIVAAKSEIIAIDAAIKASEVGDKVELNINVPVFKRVCTENKDAIKCSDTESVCSEVSTVSYCSTKRFTEKQVFVLGEDNIDSDDSSIRTRQRFEIVPGKKRKRTLSGEFDLVDEKQLRKEKKAKLLGDDDNHIGNQPEVEGNTSETKLSPKPKIKKHKKFTNGESFKLRKLKLRRESPFLTSGKKKRRKRRLKLSPPKKKHVRAAKTIGNTHGKVQKGVGLLNNTNIFSAGQHTESVAAIIHDDSSAKSDGSMTRKGIFEQFVPWEKQTLLKQSDRMSPDKTAEIVKQLDETDTDEVVIDVLTNIVNSVVKSREQHVGSYAESLEHMNYFMHIQTSSPLASVSSTNKLQLPDISQNTAEQAIGPTTKNILNKVRGRRGRKRFGPLPIARNPLLEKANPKFGRGRKANVGPRKNRQHKASTASENNNKVESVTEEGMAYETILKPKVIRSRTARKSATPSKSHETSLSVASVDKSGVKTSPESTFTRKIELRQKISRSPLDNIAKKQTIEENKYLKIEQMKALRKEAKLKSKMFKAANIEAANSMQIISSVAIESDTIDSENCGDIEDDSEIEVKTTKFSIEEQIKKMKKCSVVLNDFIKKLNLTSNDGTTSECETSALEESIDEDNSLSTANDNLNSNVDTDNQDLIDSETLGSCNNFDTISVENIHCEEHKVNKENPEVKDDAILESGKGVVVQDSCSIDETKLDILKVQSANNDSILECDLFAGQSSQSLIVDNILAKKEMPLDSCAEVNNVKSNDTSDNIKIDGELNAIPDVVLNEQAEKIDQSKAVLCPKTRSPKKVHSVKVVSNSEATNDQDSGETESITLSCYEKVLKPEMSQTARKTVPPLKIKVKGLSSRRKTYMVEQPPDSSGDASNGCEQKSEKKRKTKSGSRSESDSEKHSKNMQKKGKTMGVKCNGLAGESPSKTFNSLKPSPAKNNLKPTDAFEANFLQFIQDKNNESNNLITMKPRNLSPKMLKDQNASTQITDGNVSSHGHAAAGSADNASKTDTDESVRYVCYMCKDVSYHSNEQILKHYKEVHPTVEFMYKQLPDDLTEATAAAAVEIGKHESFPSADEDGTVQSDLAIHEDDDDDESGSLKLKIVNVVSLKDEMMSDDLSSLAPPFDKPPPPYPASNSTIRQPSTSVELRIPGYSSSTNISVANPNITNISQETYSRFLVQFQGMPVFQQQSVQLAVPQRPQHKLIAPAKPPSTGGKVTNTFKCEKCNVHAPLLPPLVSHLRNIHKDIPRLFQCPYCKDLEAETENKIIDHIRERHPTDNPNPPVALSEPAKRNLATVTVLLPDKFKLSENNLLERDIFLCLICKIYMPSIETISDHLEEKHPEVFLFLCPHCKEFKSKTEQSVLVHILHVHRKSTADASIPRAIEGTQFTRVACIVKEKNKRGHNNQQKTHHNTSPSNPSQVPVCSPSSLLTVSSFLQTPSSLLTVSSSLQTPSSLLTVSSSLQTHIVSQPILSMSAPLQTTQLFTAFPKAIAQPKFNNFQTTGISQPTGIALFQATHSLPNNQPLLSTSSATSRVNIPLQPPTLSLSLAIPSSVSSVFSQPISLGTVSSADSSVPSSLRKALTSAEVVTTSALSKPVSQPRKKKNLLESINLLKMQKEKEIELQAKTPDVTSSAVSSTVSRASSIPPPLMRAPPPLIRYDHLDKLESSPSSIISSAMRLTSQAPTTGTMTTTSLNSISLTHIPKPIHSSLFDTSDLDGARQTNRPVLNVPQISRSAKSPLLQTSSTGSPRVSHEHGSENILDLSKNSPAPSPIQTPSPKPSTSGVPQQENLNAEMFKVFNLKPNGLVQVSRPTIVSMPQPIPQFSQPMIAPQQVRQNTPNTLAYRQPVPQLIATSQVPQIINMPITMPLIGNMLFSLPQGNPNMPRFIQMSPSSLPAAGFVAASQPLNITNSQTQPAFATSLTSQQLLNLSSLNLSTFKCPYCPRVVPLKFEHVQQHIETKHPGSSIMFLPLENQPTKTNPVVLAPAKE